MFKFYQIFARLQLLISFDVSSNLFTRLGLQADTSASPKHSHSPNQVSPGLAFTKDSTLAC